MGRTIQTVEKRSADMTSIAKKKKCTRTLLDRGGVKGPIFKLKRNAMYHKKDRMGNKKACKEGVQEWLVKNANITVI